MNFVQKMKVERLVQRLKQAHSLSRQELEEVQHQVAAMGPAAIEPMLGCLGHAEARPPALLVLEHLLSDDTMGLYVQTLGSPNPAIASGMVHVLSRGKRYRAGQLLSFLTDPSVPKAALARVLEARAAAVRPREVLAVFTNLDKDGRTLLFRILERALTPERAPQLVPLLEHPDGWVRHRAVELLSRFGSDEVIEGLVRVLRDENRSVRLAAVRGLEALKSHKAIPALAGALRDPDLKVQSAAIDALVGFGDASAVPHLLTVLTDESEQARRGAVEVLNAVATTAAIQDLLRALNDADWWVRVRAADALGALGGDKVVDAVLGLLDDPEEFIRRYAVEILITIPTPRAVPHLIGSLEDLDWWVRERAIDALAKIGDPRAVEPLLAVMNRIPETVPLAARALGSIGDPRAVEPLSQLVHSDRADVRREAVAALRALAAKVEPSHSAAAKIAAAMPAPKSEHVPFRVEAGRGGRVAEGTPRGVPLPGLSPTAAPSPPRVAAPLQFGDLPAGTRLLERYHVQRRVGTGGFGTVYLVVDSAVQEEIILKVLNPQLSVDANAIRRFVQELKLTRRITHRNVIRIHDFLDLNGAHAVSMEYFPSRDLGHILVEEGPMRPERALRLVAQVCQGLAAAHEVGVIHRDIKPANILVGEGDMAKIVDFGLAAAQQTVGPRLTREGYLIGTPEYMAPELIQNEPFDHRSDIYSIGIMMYEMLSGQRPYTGDTPVKILFQHLEGNAEPLAMFVPTLRPSLAALVMRTMARQVAARPRDTRELGALVHAELRAMGVNVEGD
ncbi:MAG TPA: HEAT repeat domain-containing protein [Candidatus Krumholzibacteria bacterium]|nr:HEAT repeat domain-containing protein [Candidatus Krumholzibacteria bacterium]